MRRTIILLAAAATVLLPAAPAPACYSRPAVSPGYRQMPTRPPSWEGAGYPGCCDPSNPDPGHHWRYRVQPIPVRQLPR